MKLSSFLLLVNHMLMTPGTNFVNLTKILVVEGKVVLTHVIKASRGSGVSGVPRGGGFGGFKPPPKFRSFDKVEPDCKLSRKCLVFLFQHPN